MMSPVSVLLATCLGVGCSAPKTNKSAPASRPATSQPAAAAAAAAVATVTPGSGDEHDLEVSPEFQAEAFSADLDGDKKPEGIRWTCDKKLSLQVAAARAAATYDISDLIGCSVAVVSLRPNAASRQLLVTVDEHEEAGPDHHFLYAFGGGRLTLIWSDTAELTLRKDGTWTTQTSDCDDIKHVRRTATHSMAWDGKKVSTSRSVATTPVAAGDCAEP